MTNEKIPHQLLIIGNGFDLYCKLKSSFTDYLCSNNKDYEMMFEKLYKQLDPIYKRYQKSDKTLSATSDIYQTLVIHEQYQLELILHLTYDGNFELWKDVEGALNNLVKQEHPNSIAHSDSIWTEAYSHYSEERFDNSSAGKIAKMCFLFDRVTNATITKIDEWNRKLVFLIGRFEKNFAAYLQEKYRTATKPLGIYKERKNFLLGEIVGENEGLPMNILSFNYTTPDFDVTNARILNVEHVHGKLSGFIRHNEIIIGIDSKQLSPSQFGHQLTKTYRKAAAFVLKRNKEVKEILSNGAPETIKFFGHSLNKQDYSYFQSIFDTFDLYNSTVKLHFFFTIHNQEEEMKIRNEVINSVVSLIEEYGRSFTINKEQGKNLLHKLLLQNRLAITEIPN